MRKKRKRTRRLRVYVKPEIKGVSNLAERVKKLRDVSDRTIPVFGVAVHTTGSGIVSDALKLGADPLAYAVEYYLDPRNYFAHYVVGYDGKIIQISDEHERASHVGQDEESRLGYVSGAWEKTAGPSFVALWKKRWPTYKTPAHLYPGTSPNNAYVGIELLPTQTGAGAPMKPGLKYSLEQHRAVARLALDIATRWGFPAGWENTGRFATHEDLTPLERMTKKEGWDPGVNRAQPWIDWSYLVHSIRRLKAGTPLLVSRRTRKSGSSRSRKRGRR